MWKSGLCARELRGPLHAKEEVAREQRMPRAFGDQPDRQLLRGVGPPAQVLDPELAGGQVLLHPVDQRVEPRRFERLVHRAPGHVGLGRRITDDELVLGRAAGVRGGVDDERPPDADPSQTSANRLFVKRGLEIVTMDPGRLVETEKLKRIGGGGRGRHVHPFVVGLGSTPRNAPWETGTARQDTAL